MWTKGSLLVAAALTGMMLTGGANAQAAVAAGGHESHGQRLCQPKPGQFMLDHPGYEDPASLYRQLGHAAVRSARAKVSGASDGHCRVGYYFLLERADPERRQLVHVYQRIRILPAEKITMNARQV